MKRCIFFLMGFTLFSLTIFAERITKVAILDYSRVLATFYADSAESRRIDEMKRVFAEEVSKIQEEIQSLEEKQLNAEDLGDSRTAIELDSKIQERKQYYQEYVRVRGNQIQQSLANLSSSNALAQEILREIQYVAETYGFSIVLKRSDPNLLWWSYETDITEEVLKRLMKIE